MAKLAENGLLEESVWDYPRPPAVVPCERRVRIQHGDVVVAESESALRVLETASPPTIYIPAADVRTDLLEDAPGKHSVCEWKGRASYFHLGGGAGRVEHAAWTYPEPKAAYAELRDHYAFYAGRVDACFLDDERVTPQGGDFYGGWVTAEVVGPYKGEPGSEGW